MNLSEEFTTEPVTVPSSDEISTAPFTTPFNPTIYPLVDTVESPEVDSIVEAAVLPGEDQTLEQFSNYTNYIVNATDHSSEQSLPIDMPVNMTQEEYELKQLQKKKDKEVKKLMKKMDKFKKKLRKIDAETQELYDDLQKLDDKSQDVFDDIQKLNDKTQDLYDAGYDIMSDMKDFLKKNANESKALVLLETSSKVTEEDEEEEEEEELESDKESESDDKK